jgi:hypothetical protein
MQDNSIEGLDKKFTEAANLFQDLQQQGYLFISLATVPHSRVTFKVDEKTLKSSLSGKEVSYKNFRKFADEITELMTLCLTGDEERIHRKAKERVRKSRPHRGGGRRAS